MLFKVDAVSDLQMVSSAADPPNLFCSVWSESPKLVPAADITSPPKLGALATTTEVTSGRLYENSTGADDTCRRESATCLCTVARIAWLPPTPGATRHDSTRLLTKVLSVHRVSPTLMLTVLS
jgi:hypothetical protein